MKSYLDEPFAIQTNKQGAADVPSPLAGEGEGEGEKIEGVRVGRITGIDESGRLRVDFPGNGQGPVVARVTASVRQPDLRKSGIGREVLLVFENNDPKLPIIIDAMHSLLDEVSKSNEVVLEAKKPEDVIIDGKRLTFDAKDEIELRCGKSSIILTRAGKILLRGEYILSRSSGANRIKGGSIQLN